ncbi:MAG: hypothetical protein PPP58_12580 [Natronomonas sp.]
MDDGCLPQETHSRAVTPIVGKALEAAIVVFYIALLTTILYGSVVPEYRAVAGTEVADRTVADVATDVEAAVPPEAFAADVTVAVELPRTIDGSEYRIQAVGERLRLEHPNPDLGVEVTLSLPGHVDSVSGEWHSDDPAEINVTTADGTTEVTLG